MDKREPNTTDIKDDSDEEKHRAMEPLLGAGPLLNKTDNSSQASNSRTSQVSRKLMKKSALEMDEMRGTRGTRETTPMIQPQSESYDDLFETDDENADDDMPEVDRCQPMNFECLRLLRLLLWKNVWVQSIKRHYILTGFEFLLPLLFTLIFAVKNATFDPSGLDNRNITVYAPMGDKELMRNLYEQIECPNCLIAFAPTSYYTNLTVDKMKNLFNDTAYNPEGKNYTTVWKGFRSELELEAHWQLHVQSGNTSFKAAIIFENGFSIPPSGKVPQNHTFSYTIRIPEVSHEIDFFTGMYRAPEQNASDPYPKVASALQILVDKVLVDQIVTEGFPTERILLQAFPRLRTPVTNSQTIGKYFNAMFPMLLSLGFIFIIPSVVGAIVREKESGMRELLRANGLPRLVNWLGWMVKSVIIATITTVFVCFLLFVPFNLYVGAIVKAPGLFLPWALLLFLFGIAATSWCVLISSLCDQMVVAVAAGIYVWVLSYLLWAANFLYQLSTGWKYVFCIFPNLALTFGAEILLKLDEARASSEDSSVVKNLTSSFYKILSEILACTFLYIILGLYLENVLSTRFGARRPWNFFILPLPEVYKALTGHRRGKVKKFSPNIVRTYRLQKGFGFKTVDCASVRFESGQTTVLLGENGAGKSTLLSMLAGIQLPNEGYAYINGRSIDTIPQLERQSVGYCPQLNTFWNDMTVGEHVHFFAMLKMIRKTSFVANAAFGSYSVLLDAGLADDADKLPSALSGGGKRRLNVAMAITGDPGVRLLDEPTSGVDAGAIEELINQYSGHYTTTVVTSHVMSELYGNPWRVAVFDKGRLKMVKKGRFVDYMNRPHDDTNETDTASCANYSGNPLRNINGKHLREAPILGRNRLQRQFRALILKRLLQAWRNKRLLIIQFIIPLVVSIVAISAGNQIRNRYSTQPYPAQIQLAAYESPVILFSSSNTTQYNEEIFTSLVPRGAEKVANVTERLLKIAENDSQIYREHYILAIELDSFEVKAMFSSTRSAPVALNLATNYILRTKTGNDRPSIEVNSNKLSNKVPAPLDAANPTPTFVTSIALLMVATLPIGLSILAAGFIVVPVAEKASKMKLLQFMTGVSGWIYWGSSFTWDFALMAVISGLLTLLFAFIGSDDTFLNKAAMGVMLLMFLAYGFAAISFSYLVSSINRQLSNTPNAFTILMTIHFLSATIGTTVVYSLEMLDLGGIARTMSYGFSLLPSFAISWSILRFTEIATSNSRCRAVDATLKEHLCDKNNAFDLRYRSCCDLCTKYFPDAPCFEAQPYLEWFSTRRTPQLSTEGIGIGMEVFIMVAVGFGCLLLLAVFSRHGAKTSTDSSPSGLKASNIRKSYDSGSGVYRFNLEVKPGEPFALIGRNGAGKSTVLRILAGDDLPSRGHVRIGQVRMEKDWRKFGFFSKKYLSQIGYCPQHDGLIEALTGKEILKLFVNLLGFEQGKGHEKIEYWIKMLGLESAIYTQCRNLTGGMKRRLSLAIAIIGSPSVVLLDEPTAGVDLKGRERLRKVIERLKDPDRSIIVSTHDAEECRKLCSSVGIMQRGEMTEVGSVDVLKQIYIDIMIGHEDEHEFGTTFMMLSAIVAKYRPGVEKFGSAENATRRNGFIYWLCLRGRENEEEPKKFQQKILNEAILHAGDFGPGFRNKGLPRLTIDAEAGIEQIFSYLTQVRRNCHSNCNDFMSADIESKIDWIENDAEASTPAPAKYSISRQREWFRSTFDKQRSQVSDPKDGKSCNSEENLRCKMSPPIGIIPLLCLKISNHSTSDLRRYLGRPQRYLDDETQAFKGPDVVRKHTKETFHLGKNDTGKKLEPVWLGLGRYEALLIACMELDHGVLLLSAGFVSLFHDFHVVKPRAEVLLDLPTCPDTCTIRIDSLTAQYESFAKLGDFLLRVYVPVVPKAIYRTIEVDLVEIDGHVRMEVELDQRRSIYLDCIFWKSSFDFQFYYVQPLLRLLNNPRKWDCVAIIDIENALNVSLTNGIEKIIAHPQDRLAGTQNSRRAYFCESRKLDPPTEVLASTREIFYECGSMSIQRMFSYQIESTNLSIVIGLNVQEDDSSFAFAFVESSAVENETLETLMDPSKSNDRRHRKFGYAKNGEEAVQIRNIIASVSMTEPKYKRIRRKGPLSTSFSLHEDNGYNVNSQLNIHTYPNGEELCLIMGYLPLENKTFLLSSGLVNSFFHDYSSKIGRKVNDRIVVEPVLDLTNSADVWSAGAIPLKKQFETFVKYDENVKTS